MAQETVIHRIDAELGVGLSVAPVPDDLALDGIDELLKVFVSYSVGKWADYFTEVLADSPARTYAITTDGADWFVKTSPGRFDVEGGPGAEVTDGATPDVAASGTPAALLHWVWNRETPDAATGVTIEGNLDALTEFRRCVVIATQ
jgi:hypothetical protein